MAVAKSKKVKVLIVCACICAAVAAATAGVCVFSASHGKKADKSDIVYSNSSNFASDNGFYHIKGGNSDGEYYYFDFKSHKSVLLSNRPNAEVSDAKFAATPLTLTYYNNALYAFTFEGANKSVIYRADADGSNKSVFMKINSNIQMGTVFMKNRIYYTGTTETGTKNDPNDIVSEKASLHVIDIAKKTDTQLAKEREGLQANMCIMGAYKNKLYYYCQVLDKKVDYRKIAKGNAEEREKYTQSLMAQEKLYEYNLDTGVETDLSFKFPSTDNPRVQADSIYCVRTDPATKIKTIERYNLDTGNTSKIYSDINLNNDVHLIGDYLFCYVGAFDGKYVPYNSQKYTFCYDTVTGKMRKINTTLSSNSFITIEYSTPDGFVVTVSKDVVNGVSRNSTYAYIAKPDLFAGKHIFISFT